MAAFTVTKAPGFCMAGERLCNSQLNTHNFQLITHNNYEKGVAELGYEFKIS